MQPFDLRIGQHKGGHPLGVVFHHRLGDVVLIGAVPAAVVLRPQSRYQADAAQIQS